MKQNKNSRLDMQHGGQVNRHLGWVRLFWFFFFSSVALVVARWEHVTLSVLAAAVCPGMHFVAQNVLLLRLPSPLLIGQKNLEKMYRAVDRKTRSIIVFQVEKPVWIFVGGDDVTIRMRSESHGNTKKNSMCVHVNRLHAHTHWERHFLQDHWLAERPQTTGITQAHIVMQFPP